MRLRPALLLVPCLLGALWVAFETREARVERDYVPLAEQESGPGARDARALAEPRPPVVPADARTAVEEPLAPVVGETVASEHENAHAPPSASRGTSRGRLVDQATLEPIPDALVVTAKLNDWTDADGWFDTGEALDGLEEILVLNVGSNTDSPEVPRERWTRLEGAWQVPLAIGPTFRLRFSGDGEPPAAPWEARLSFAGRGQRPWRPVRAGPPPYLRFDRPFGAADGAAACWLEARSQDGLLEGRGEVTSLVGVQEVEVVCRARAVVRGRVVDAQGTPWNGVTVDASQVSDDGIEQLGTGTGADGSYQVSASAPGRMQLVFLPPSSTETRSCRLEVPRGITRAPDVVLERRPAGGAIRGSVKTRSGEDQWGLVVALRALDGSGWERAEALIARGGNVSVIVSNEPVLLRREPELFREPEDEGTVDFLFEDVPAGRFELSLLSSFGFTSSPPALVVEAPAEGVLFTLEDTEPVRPFVLELVDEESGLPLEGLLAHVRVAGASSERGLAAKQGEPIVELAESARFEWTATCPGYRLERGSERDFRREGEALVARRTARRGWGVRLKLIDRSGRPRTLPLELGAPRWRSAVVAGAEVLADGELVATSDARGIAELDLASAPDRIEVRLPGWRVLDSPDFEGGTVRTLPVAEVLLLRE
jgi:hypothetical protein